MRFRGWIAACSIRLISVLLITVILTGCTGKKATTNTPDPPADFTLEVYIHHFDADTSPAAASAMGRAVRQTSQYLLEPNRDLRAVMGPWVSDRIYPPPVRRLTYAQLQTLWKIIQVNHLLAEPTSPNGQILMEHLGKRSANPLSVPAPAILYRVRILAGGRTYEFSTTPQESPPTLALIAELVKLRTEDRAMRNLSPEH
ncbi:MAG: hypothetical protein IT442_08040 [Phycisphaeraceae bacterium]|nr:hypothetical protein [Phycisphaeraceae bacterium]